MSIAFCLNLGDGETADKVLENIGGLGGEGVVAIACFQDPLVAVF